MALAATGSRQKVTKSSLRSALCRTAGEINPPATGKPYPGKLGDKVCIYIYNIHIYVTGQESRLPESIPCSLYRVAHSRAVSPQLSSAALYWARHLQVQSHFLVRVAVMRCTMRACLAVQVLLAALITQSMAQPESGLPCKLRRIHTSSTCNYACFNSVFSQSCLAHIP